MNNPLSHELVAYWLSADSQAVEAVLGLMDVVPLEQVDIVELLKDEEVLITPHRVAAIRRIGCEVELEPTQLLWLLKASDAEIMIFDWEVSSANYQLAS